MNEGAPAEGSGRIGAGKPTDIGTGYVAREACDGQTLVSPNRWLVQARGHPADTTRRVGMPLFGLRHALGGVADCLPDAEEIVVLKRYVVDLLGTRA